MSYLHLLLAVISLGMLGVLHKVADHRRCRPQAINLILFLCATLVLGLTASLRSGPSAILGLPGRVLAVGAMCGICAGLAILNFQHAVRFGKISTSWLLINLSTAVPTVLSIFGLPRAGDAKACGKHVSHGRRAEPALDRPQGRGA